MPKRQLFLIILLSGLALVAWYIDGRLGGGRGVVLIIGIAASTLVAAAFAYLFGENESKSNEGTLETDSKAFDLTAELAKLDKLKKDGLITAEDYEVLKKRAIEKAKE